ncbi:type II secretion system protein D [Rhodoferax lithotrophicus]|uniref:Type II secretion system protein D n=1 Tax=Rhodoferax lithotrophicus TaxID=2798804 RepID=A0ABM7MJP6_9BURK|nr:type II secretion system secretin GspD [Rhodoferax sp. MIZ03]BCO26410.1 type II secretion system protein D [Rhodoferax sp. MIZ03]
MRQHPSQLHPHSFKNTIISIAICALLTGTTGLFSLKAAAQSNTPVKASEAVTLNFQGAEIEAVARTFASITGRNVVVDPRVKGTLTLVSDKPVNRAAALGQFVAALRLQGFTLVESGGLYKVVPEAEAKMQSAGVTIQDNSSANLPASNQIATQIFNLHHESANNLVAVLRPLISPNNTINANPGSNSLVITDYGDNLRRLSLIIAALDVANATDAEVIPLKHALAADLVPLVQRLIGLNTAAAPAGTSDTSFKTTLMAEARSNAVIVRAANGAQMALVRSLIQKLDQPDVDSGNGLAGNIHVVYLKNADATKLAVTLRAAMSNSASPATAAVTTTAAAGTPASPAVTTGGQIQADASTNSLIITAPEPQYRQLRAVIDKLDARRAQVFVESLIAEVSMDKAAEFGIQWQGPLGNAGSGVIGLLGSNFGTGGKNIINLATGAGSGTVVPGRGLNIGAAQNVNGVYVLGFLARFLEDSGSGNVLSTPNLLTLDNEEAKIVIGQNVPFVTGQFTNTGSTSSGTVNPFQTIERKDVGLTLKVKPQISENGTVKMAIYQEVSNVLASTVNAPNGPTTNKRTIESNVLVEDGAIVVLGGLLQDEYAGNQEKVPGLGDVPFFGNLFKSESRSRKKTNLMVFLRPVVVRDAHATDKLSMDRYDLMRTGMQTAQPTPSSMVPVNEAPVLPAAQGKSGTATSADLKPLDK